ncbi:LysR family transcriptional regulator [Anaeromicropila herbilytica]|uniref:LysR family transcriptional regulator n=1 Tax=Anaeromicropila herbilytica TaxID=2785025 RepID=A0A7R7EJV5_9FIRM|nr:LysR family transcriptional regulator [Anaeromicropila herbilytica]BCN30191.1 LysR family transcriptional regulator [Anaeromicropila herbilytica]
MDTQTLKTFLVLSKLKNFTLTAEHLFVAQSTVTNRIAELEKELGKSLFHRQRKNLTLTEEGLVFYQYANRILELEESALHDINSSAFYRNSIRIGTTNTIYECHLFPKMKAFLDSHEDTSVKLFFGHSLELIEMLQDHLLDVVFSYLPLKKTGFHCTSFISDELLLVTSPRNTAYAKGILKSDLTKINYLFCNFALQEVGQFIRELFPPYYQFSFEIDNSTKLIPYLLTGTGYSFLPRSLVKPYLTSGEFITIPILDFSTPVINSYQIQRDDKSSKSLWNI